MAARNENVTFSVDDADDQGQEEDQRAWQEEFEARRRKVQSATAVQTNLDTLKRAGAETDRVLQLLVLSAQPKPGPIIRDVNRQQRRLQRLADRLDQVAVELQSVFSDPRTSSAFWSAFMFAEDLDITVGELTGRFDARLILRNRTAELMQQCSQSARPEERELTVILKAAKKWAEADACIVALIEHIYTRTGKFYDDLLAALLQSAHDALNSPRKFSAEALRKFRQRHTGPRMGLLVREPIVPVRH